MKNLHSTISQGFTLLETLVAITMLTLVIGTIMGLMQNNLNANAVAKDQITAKYLAEEGIEYIRNLRDFNMINNGQSNWMANIAGTASGPCGRVDTVSTSLACYVDAVNGGLPQACTSLTSCPVLNYDSSTGKYSYKAGLPASKFTRYIVVTGVDGTGNFNSTYSAKVHVTVTWQENFGLQSYSTDEISLWCIPFK